MTGTGIAGAVDYQAATHAAALRVVEAARVWSFWIERHELYSKYTTCQSGTLNAIRKGMADAETALKAAVEAFPDAKKDDG